jgi:hypothetical protein
MNIQELLQKPIDQLSNDELEQVIAQRKKAEKAKAEKERKDYEASRDADAISLFKGAYHLSQGLQLFKYDCHEILEKHQQKLNEYGSIRSNSKGGFSMLSTDKKIKIRRRRDTMPSWDERSIKALELIHAFLNDFVKKRDQKMFEILMGFLVKNKKGDLEYSSVMNLLQHEDKFDDNRWKEGLRLIKESYSSYLKGYQYDFELLNETSGKYEKIELNFSAL